MRRLLLGTLLATCAALLAFGYAELTRDGQYRDLIAGGDQAVAEGDPIAAIEAFSGAIALKPSYMLGWLRRGETYQLRGELGPALRDLRRAVDLDPSSPRANERLGDVLLAMGRYSRASEQYEAHLAVDDRAPNVLLKLGLARFHEGRCGPAEGALRRALALDDRLAEAHYLMGLCAVEAGERTAAVSAFRRALELSPGLLPAREELAALYASLGRRADELRQLETLASLDSDAPGRAVALGLAQARHGRTDAALSTLGRALDRFDDEPVLLLALGRLWLELALQREDRAALERALDTLSRAAARQPSGEALALLGRAQLRAGQERQAFRTLQDAVEQLPVPNEAFAWLAEAAERAGEAALARDALVQHLAVEGERLGEEERARETRQVVELSLQAQDPRAALRHFERHATLLADDAALCTRLVAALWAAGAEDEARALLTSAIARHPAHPPLAALRARIP
jgi:tetratricopeptide (TPR) repeat protein